MKKVYLHGSQIIDPAKINSAASKLFLYIAQKWKRKAATYFIKYYFKST